MIKVCAPRSSQLRGKQVGFTLNEREFAYKLYTECVQRVSWYPQISYIGHTILESFDVSPVERWNQPHYRTSCYEQHCRRRFIPTPWSSSEGVSKRLLPADQPQNPEK